MRPYHRRSRVLLICALLFGTLVGLFWPAPRPAAAGTAYTIIDLGSLRPDNSGRSNASAINASGQIVGSAVFGAELIGHAFRREPDGPMRDLGTIHPVNLGGSSALGINAAGAVVGSSLLPTGQERATLWQFGPGGAISKRDLGDLTPDASGRSIAFDINDEGVIVGDSTLLSTPDFQLGPHAVRWQIAQDGSIEKLDLGTLMPYDSGTSFAWGINNAGLIVGSAESFGGYTAIRWQVGANNTISELNLGTASPNVIGSVAYAINDAGQIVGMRAVADGFDTQGTLWKVAENGQISYRHLPALLEGARGISTARAINNDGVIVGESSVIPWPAHDPAGHHAVRWLVNPDDSVSVVDLNSLIPTTSGWELLGAGDINDAGQIVGTGLRNGELRAFLLTPVAGTTLALTTRNSVTGKLDARELGAITVGPAAAPGPYAPGTVVTLTAQPRPNAIFTGWVVDGAPRGWADRLALTMDGDHRVQASFGPRPDFTDVAPGDPARAAIEQLAARGVVQGYGFFGCRPPRAYPCYGPADDVNRAQAAVMLVRALDWRNESPWPMPFDDLDTTDAEMIRAIGILANKGVVAGYGDGHFGPDDPVLRAQVLSIIARAMVAAGHWDPVTADDPAIYPNIPADAPHRLDILTFVAHAGPVPDRPTAGGWPDWLAVGSRAWTARVLWQALDSTFGP